MSPVAIGLDGLLALLLVAALVLGARLNTRLKALRDGQAGFAAAVLELNQAAARAEAGLNTRLKALRDGQAGFAAAVLELNQAAARAEAGLNALKTAQGDAHDELLGRIEVARGLAAKLERVGEEAERRAARTPVHAAEPAPRAPVAAAGGALAAIAALAEGRAPVRAAAGADLSAERGRTLAEDAAALRANPPPRRKPARGAFDEELFETKSTRRDDPFGLGALHRDPAEGATASAPSAPAADFGPLTPRAPDEARPRPDPLRDWKAVR